MSDRTPGPRQVRRFDSAQIVVLGAPRDGRRELIGTFTGDNREENAALDAAGPDLLYELEQLVECVEGQGWHRSTTEAARAAIAKATP